MCGTPKPLSRTIVTSRCRAASRCARRRSGFTPKVASLKNFGMSAALEPRRGVDEVAVHLQLVGGVLRPRRVRAVRLGRRAGGEEGAQVGGVRQAVRAGGQDVPEAAAVVRAVGLDGRVARSPGSAAAAAAGPAAAPRRAPRRRSRLRTRRRTPACPASRGVAWREQNTRPAVRVRRLVVRARPGPARRPRRSPRSPRRRARTPRPRAPGVPSKGRSR